MKMITIISIIIYLTQNTNGQNYQNEPYHFPPKYQTPNPTYTIDNSMYLPPENHSPLPFFAIKNMNNLQYPYLPATGTRAPPIYPSPFPMVSSVIPNFDDDDDDEETSKENLPSNAANKTNQTEKRESKTLPKNFEFRSPIDRADIKMPFQYGTMAPPSQTPASRRMIISSETVRDQAGDQVKSPSIQSLQYIQGPGFISSTTEPAIPILRLSNEMDLDGSFSYEALGADQTHYVQHSRMENTGSDKEEQVVEGSYSYVGDNGQTFTVHYVADSNGFRASGDHLPVAPPVPEIIQRAIQYNLAEEAKRPPHLRSSWEDDDRENHEFNERERNSYNKPIQATRGLFTGKSPEAFSFNFPQQQQQTQQNSQNNNFVTAASNQAPVKTVEFPKDQTHNKPNNAASISPQITFLASQGAHVPSLTATPPPAPQQSISRTFIEKPLPQLMNYEANEHENNKALWRWQLAHNNNNNNHNNNHNRNSISRSFSEGDDVMINFNDMTNEEYTKMLRSELDLGKEKQQAVPSSQNEKYVLPEMRYFSFPNNLEARPQIPQNQQQTYQYAIKQPVEISSPYSNSWQNTPNQIVNEAQNKSFSQNQEKVLKNNPSTSSYNQQNQWYNTPRATPETPSTEAMKNTPLTDPSNPQTTPVQQNYSDSKFVQSKREGEDVEYSKTYTTQKPIENVKIPESRYLEPPFSHNNLITQKHFIPKSQTVTQSYDYDETFYEPRKIKSFNYNYPSTMTNLINYNQAVSKENIGDNFSSTNNYFNSDEYKSTENNDAGLSTTTEVISYSPTPRSLKFTDFIVKGDDDNSFKPMITSEKSQIEKDLITTTSTESIEEMLENNIFLKNFVKPNKPNDNFHNNFNSESTKNKQITEPILESKADKSPKYFYTNPDSEMKVLKNKPIDLTNVLNFINYKNGFEPNKVKPKSKPIFNEHKKDTYYTDHKEIKEKESIPHKKGLNAQQQEELRGIIKNYKVLNRNHMNHNYNNQVRLDNMNQLPMRMMQPAQQPNTPPLGRAGPTVKAYLPPIYVY